MTSTRRHLFGAVIINPDQTVMTRLCIIADRLLLDGVISRFLQSETISGNLYMVSSGQSFALPLRVLVDKYLADSQKPSQKIKHDLDKRFPTVGLREKLLARRKTMR